MVLLIQFLSFWPLWRWYGERMLDGSDEPWGILALLASVMIIAMRSKEEGTVRQKRGGMNIAEDSEPPCAPLGRIRCHMSSLGFLLFSLAYIATYQWTPFLVKGVLVISALAGLHLQSMKGGSAMYALLLLSLPLVSSLEFYLGYPLRLVLSYIVALVLRHGGGLEVVAEGTVLNWNGSIVIVDAPCSGIKMLWVGMFINFLLASLMKFSVRQTLIATGFALRTIFIANVARVTLLFFKESGLVSLPSWTHAGIGVICFTGAAVCITFRNRRLCHVA
jgi:exosortase/archaeosortase family protein